MKLEFNNIFLATLRFGISFNNEIVLAKDQEEAIKAVNDCYAEPEITAIINIEEMISILNKFLEREDLVLIQELDVDDEGLLNVKVSEYFGELIDAKSKFYKSHAILLNKDSAFFTMLNSLNNIKSGQFYPIIGSSYER